MSPLGIPQQPLPVRWRRAGRRRWHWLLWWRLTDAKDVTQSAYKALVWAVACLTELEVAALPLRNSTIAPPFSSRQLAVRLREGKTGKDERP